MDLKKIKKLIELLQSSELSGLEVQEGESIIKLTRELKVSSIPANTNHTPPIYTAYNPITLPEKSSSPEADIYYVRSPMVGTFYRGPSPEKPPLISIGDTVKKGDTLCIIEAMKILNFIQAEKSGLVKNILVNNGEAVEFEQPLFVIE